MRQESRLKHSDIHVEGNKWVFLEAANYAVK